MPHISLMGQEGGCQRGYLGPGASVRTLMAEHLDARAQVRDICRRWAETPEAAY